MSDAEQARKDNVNHPGHYTFGKYEVIDILEDWFPADPRSGGLNPVR